VRDVRCLEERNLAPCCRVYEEEIINVAQLEARTARILHAVVILRCDAPRIAVFPNRPRKKRHALATRDEVDCTIRRGWHKLQEATACDC
jgi:hypothetical protein